MSGLTFLIHRGGVERDIFDKMFRKAFPTGEPEDYEPEMRLKMAELFLTAKPVDLTSPIEAALQRQKVFNKFVREDNRNGAWVFGQFDIDFDGAIRVEQADMERTPALEWMTDVQQNAASIVAAAEQTRGDALEASAPSWDMSSVMESPSTSHGKTEMPTTFDTNEHAPVPDVEIEAAIEKSLTSQPREVPPDERPDTPSEIQSNLETTLKSQFSSERFERAMDTLERYGPEEGIHRLRENDPEVAKQIEQHQNRKEVSP